MQWFAPNIVVDGSHIPNKPGQDRYESSVIRVRDTIVNTPFGKDLIELIGNNREPIVIAPTPNRNIAAARPLDADKAFAQGATVVRRSGPPTVGLGTGSIAIVDFNPTGDLQGATVDSTLVHELVHAWRQARGKWKAAPISDFVDASDQKKSASARADFENWEEFLAVVVEGVYAAQAGAGSVRVSHNIMAFWRALPSTGPMTPDILNPVPLTDSQRFAQTWRRALIAIMGEELELYRLLLGAKAWFNPVRDMANMRRYLDSLRTPTDPSAGGLFRPGWDTGPGPL